jgi:hypothetical protein
MLLYLSKLGSKSFIDHLLVVRTDGFFRLSLIKTFFFVVIIKIILTVTPTFS